MRIRFDAMVGWIKTKNNETFAENAGRKVRSYVLIGTFPKEDNDWS